MDNNDLIKDMSMDIKDLVKQGAVHNQLLLEHERRSLSLESRQEAFTEKLRPIENHIHWVNIVLKSLGAILVAVAIKIVLSFIFTS